MHVRQSPKMAMTVNYIDQLALVYTMDLPVIRMRLYQVGLG